MKVYRDIEKNGVVTQTEIFDIAECTYNGKDMGERSITSTILWATPINFKVGDYVMLSIQSLVRGVGVEGSILSGDDMERFYLYTMPTVKKTARPMSTGKAFEHNVTFYPRQYELGMVQMRDCGQEAANADTIIYTGFDSFSFVGGADELMRRIMAVLKDAYHDADGNALWSYNIADEVNEYRNTALESVNFSFSGNTVMDALLKLNDKEGINTTFFINGRTIYVGYKRPYFCRVTDGSTIDTDTDTQMFKFEYGKTSDKSIAIDHGGLYEITKSVGKESPITKLFAYGANRNLNRYYCSDRIQSGRYVNKLMLPSFDADGKTDYILSQRGIEKYGIREGSKQFEDIYPSLRYMTYGDLRQIQYCIKIKINAYENIKTTSSNDTVSESTLYHYPIARIQCYKVTQSIETEGINMLTPCAPPDDLAIMVHALGKVVKCVLYGGATNADAIAKQRAHDKIVPTYTYNGSDYIPGSCYVVHDRGFDSEGTTYVYSDRSSWFTNPMDYDGNEKFTDAQKSELRLHQIVYEDTFYLSDVYRFTDYNQTSFSRDGYSAYAWARTNADYQGGTPDSTTVNEVVAVEPVVIEDTNSNVDGLGVQQKTFDIYLRDVGFKIDEQSDFGDMIHIVGTTLTISMLDGLLAGREFTANGTVVDNQYSCICAYNDNGTLNDDFFMASQYNDTKIPTEAFANGAIWRICVNRINLDEADYSNLNLILPTKDLCVKAGDHLVFLDIFMPDIYIHAAENRLLREANKYLAANDNGSITYSAQFDKVRLQQIPNYALQMREGLNIRMVDDDLDIFTRNDSQTLFESKNGQYSSVSLVRSDADVDTETTTNTYYTIEHRSVEDMLANYPDDIVYNDITVYSKQRKVTCELGIVPEDLYPEDTELYFQDNKINYVRYISSYSSGYSGFKTLDTLQFPIESIEDTDKTYVKKITFVLDKDPKDMHLSKVQNAKYEQYYFPGLLEYDIRTKHTETSTTTTVTHKNYILPQGSRLFCPAKQLIDFRATAHYTITMDVENTSLPDFNNLFVLLNNLGENANYYTPDYDYEEISSSSSYWRRFVFTFQLESSFNDNQSYYPAIKFISDGITESVSIRLVSVVESDSEVVNGEELNYADLKIESVTVKMTNSNANASPIREITANFADNPLASTWATLMSTTETTRIEGEQNVKAVETLVNTARKNYQTLLNLRNSIFDPDGTCDQTFLQVMMLQVGADSMNYRLDNTRTGLGTNGAQVFYNCSCSKESGSWYFKVLSTDTLRHYVYTAGAQAGTWSIANGITQLLDGTSNYFVCLKCSREGSTGEWVCSTKQYAVNDTEDTNYWYFNWGILTVDSAGNYTLTETRGNAYMYGDNLVCGKISTIAGNSYFDLNNGDFVLSNGTSKALSYINGVLTISGVATETEAEDILKRLGLAEGNISSTQTAVQTAQSTADAANAAVAQVRTDYQAAITAEEQARSQAITNVQSSISGLQQQIDGEVTSWFLKGVPTTTNQPAADWTTDELKQRHEGDTYTNMLNAQADLSELSDNLPLWIEQGFLSVGTSYIGYTYEEQMRSNATVCRTKCIFNIVKGITIGAPPTGIQQLVILYDANKQYRSNTSWVTTSVSLDNYANTYKYFAIIYTVTGDGAYKTALAPSQLTTLSQTGELTTPDAGKSWRWCKGTADTPATTWHWHLIADSDAVKALVEAGKAQSTADGKSTTFVVKPTTYQKGDLWILQSDTDHTAGKKGDVLTANADSTTYTASHWSKEVKYTDDTAATAAKAAADAAQKAADAAQADATQALSDLEEVNKDGRVYISEMKQLSIELENIKQEKIQLVGTDGKGGEAQKWDASVDQTTYINAYNACVKALTYYTTESNATNGYIAIITDTSNQYSWSKITAYYSARQVLANAIATAANSYSDSIKTTAEQAVSDAATAQTAADNAKSVADAATTRLNNWANDGVISPTEKQGIKDEIARIAADKTQITNEYAKYSMGTPTAYNTVYTNYNTVLGTLSATTPETIAIPSDFSTKQKGYYDQRTIALNAIAKKADEVAQAYADDAISNMEIGGRNLLKNSANPSIDVWGTSWASGVTDKYTVSADDDYCQITINTAPTNAISTYAGIYNRITNTAWADRKITISAMLYSSYADKVKIGLIERYQQYGNETIDQYYNHTQNIAVVANKWQQVSWTFESVKDLYAASGSITPNQLYLIVAGTNTPAANAYWRVKNWKVEFGNKPTDWTPAPEDVDASIATAQSAADAAKQTLANIANDTIFTKQEKCTVKTEWASIQAEFNKNTTNASAAWGSSAYTSQTEYKAYKTAYDALSTYLTSTAQLNTATDTTIVAATFQSKFSDYYGANITLLNAIANQLAALEAASAVENINVGGENICTHDNPYTLTAGASANYMYTTLCSNLENGATYVFSCEKSELLAGTATQYRIMLYALQDSIGTQGHYLSIGSTTQSCVFTVPSDSRNYSIVLYAGVAGSTAGNSVRWTNIMVQKGNKCTEYQQPAWNRLATTSASMTYAATGTYAAKMLLTNIPIGRCKATMGYESKGTGATETELSNSCLVWLKASQTALPDVTTLNYYASNVIAVTDWGEEVTLTQKANLAVYGGTKAYIQACVNSGTTSYKAFSAADTWTVSVIYILNRKIDEAFAKTAALDYLKAALNSSTEIVGGLTMTNVLMLKNLAGDVTAGMSGLTQKTGTTTADNVLLWGGGTYDEAFAAALSANYYKSGTTPITTLLKKDGTGKIGIFKISDTQAIVDVPNQGKVIIDASSTNGGIFVQNSSGVNKITISPKTLANSGLIPAAVQTWSGSGTKSVSSTGGSSYYAYGDWSNDTITGTTLTTTGAGKLTISSLYIGISNKTGTSAGTSVTNLSMQFKIGIRNSSGTYYYTSAAVSNSTSYSNLSSVSIPSAGTYYIGVQVRTLQTVNGPSISASATVSASINARFVPSYPARTVICADGLISAYDAEHFFEVQNTSSGQKIFVQGLTSTGTSGQIVKTKGAYKDFATKLQTFMENYFTDSSKTSGFSAALASLVSALPDDTFLTTIE